jgi:hypothetical protein
MARGKQPVSAVALRRAFRKEDAELRAMRKKKKLPADKKVIDLQLKALKACEQLLSRHLLI